MKNLLTCDINGRTYMSYASRYRCAEGRAAQSGSHPTSGARTTAPSCRALGPRLDHLQAPSLSLSPSGSEAPTARSCRRCQSFFYGQAFAASGANAPHVRCLDRIDLERDRQPSVAGGPAPWGRPWLTAGQVGNARCGWNINLIGGGQRNWPKLMSAWCLTPPGSQMGPRPHRPQSTRRV